MESFWYESGFKSLVLLATGYPLLVLTFARNFHGYYSTQRGDSGPNIMRTVYVCYSCLAMGLMYAWPSSTLKLFSSTNTTLHRPMSETEIALFGSLSSIGALLGTPMSAFLLDTLGRKYTCMLFTLPQVFAWAIASVSYRVEAILAAVFISGLGGCTLLVVPVYISEFCQESIRGMMTSGAMICYGLGMLMSYLLGGILEYNLMNYVFLSMSVLAVAILWPLKESPMYLMKRGLEEDAAAAVAFFRRVKMDSKLVVNELITMRRALNPELDDLTPEEEKLKPELKSNEKMSKWKFIKKSRSTRRAIFVSLILYTAAIFQGLVVVQVYAEPLFEEAIPSMSATLSSVLLAIITVVAGCVAAYLIDLAGRRVIMIYASIAAGVCCIVLGSQIHLQWGPHWVTGVFIYMFCIAYTFGAGTVPFVLVAEVFLPEVKSLMSMLCVEWAWMCNFIILFIFNPLVSAIGLGPVFYLFATVCFSSAVFCIFFLPETKGLTVDVIQTLFAKSRKTQVPC